MTARRPTPMPAARAMGCYEKFIWIAGGVGKAGGVASLAPYFSRISKAFLIGQDAGLFAATLSLHGVANDIAGNLEAAVPAAYAEAKARNVATVLLSPAAASFDQFKSFRAARRGFCGFGSRIAGRGRIMPAVSRADTSIIGRWWWSVDRVTFAGPRRVDRHRLCAGAGGDAWHFDPYYRSAYDGDDQADCLSGMRRRADAGDVDAIAAAGQTDRAWAGCFIFPAYRFYLAAWRRGGWRASLDFAARVYPAAE